MRVLHHYPLSPSSRLIRLYMNEKKIEFVTKLETFWERNEKFLKLNRSFERQSISKEEVGGYSCFINEKGDLRILPFFLKELGGIDGFFASRLRCK